MAAVVLGYLPVSIGAARPIDISTSDGTADGLVLAIGTDSSVTGLSTTDAPRVVGLVELRDGRLADLCLLPRVDLPVVGRMLSLRIDSSAAVRLGRVTLAANGGVAQRVAMTQTTIGESAGDALADRAGRAAGSGSFAVEATGPEAVRIGGVDMQAFGLVLEGGIRLSRLTIHPALREQKC